MILQSSRMRRNVTRIVDKALKNSKRDTATVHQFCFFTIAVETHISTIMKGRNGTSAVESPKISTKVLVAVVAVSGAAVVGVVVAAGTFLTSGTTSGAAAATTAFTSMGCVLKERLFMHVYKHVIQCKLVACLKCILCLQCPLLSLRYAVNFLL